LISAGILLFGYLLAVLGLNIYLQSGGLGDRVCAAAANAIGRPVVIGKAYYTPWRGFTVTGIIVPQDEGMPPVFEAAAVNFRFLFFQLLKGRLAVGEVDVLSPVLVIRNRPKPREAVAAAEPDTPSAGSTAVEPSTGGVVIAAPEPLATPHPAPHPPAVRRVSVRNGSTRLYDVKGGLIVATSGVRVTAETMPDGRVVGKFDIAEAAVGTALHPRRITGTFAWDAGRLVIRDIEGRLAGGRLAGVFDLDPLSGYSVAATVEGALIKRLAEEAGIGAEGARGSVAAQASVRGFPGSPESMRGEADISLLDARVQPLDLIRQIGDLTGIHELRMLELKTAAAKLVIGDRQVRVQSLALESENLFVDATGPVGFDGKIKIKARMHLNEKLRNDLGGILGGRFEDSERAGCKAVPFSITGVIGRPKTDLLEKLTGIRLGQDVGGLLKSLLRIPAGGNPSPPKEAP
jgi:hypothetical protein